MMAAVILRPVNWASSRANCSACSLRILKAMLPPLLYRIFNIVYTYTPHERRQAAPPANIDETLIRDVLQATGLQTKREAVERGLQLLLRLARQARIREFHGKLHWEGNLLH
jgi:Arc/MetJ family transcription regulator